MMLADRLCVLLAAGVLLCASAAADVLTVESGKSTPVRIKGAAASVVLGNKNIADVAVHDENLLFVTGKSHGTTNLMVFDRAGRQIYSGDVVVSMSAASLVTIKRAGDTYTLDCSSNCRSVLSPGDTEAYFEFLIKQQQSLQALTDSGN
jgi:Flp pilus assembly secretin CpaC